MFCMFPNPKRATLKIYFCQINRWKRSSRFSPCLQHEHMVQWDFSFIKKKRKKTSEKIRQFEIIFNKNTKVCESAFPPRCYPSVVLFQGAMPTPAKRNMCQDNKVSLADKCENVFLSASLDTEWGFRFSFFSYTFTPRLALMSRRMSERR